MNQWIKTEWQSETYKMPIKLGDIDLSNLHENFNCGKINFNILYHYQTYTNACILATLKWASHGTNNQQEQLQHSLFKNKATKFLCTEINVKCPRKANTSQYCCSSFKVNYFHIGNSKYC